MTDRVPKVVAAHDISGFGKCSLTVALPIMSAMGIETIPLPTALLSTHTGGFEGYSFLSLTGEMKKMIAHWKSLGLKFDAIYSGFLGEDEQIDVLIDFINSEKSNGMLAVVDPVMGDNGRLYSTITPVMAERMKCLVKSADVITPNITEAALLLGKLDLGPGGLVMSFDEISDWLIELSNLGPSKVVITGVAAPDRGMYVAAYDCATDEMFKVDCNHIKGEFHGTGDIFASVLTAELMKGRALSAAIESAVEFVRRAIEETVKYPEITVREGLLFEKVLMRS